MVSLFIRCTVRFGPSPAAASVAQLVERSVWSIECRGFESHLRQLIFSRKSDYLGCAVLLCLVCLILLASFFLPSHLSFKNMYIHLHIPQASRSRFTTCTDTSLQLPRFACVYNYIFVYIKSHVYSLYTYGMAGEYCTSCM